jgi:hypothetical protein
MTYDARANQARQGLISEATPVARRESFRANRGELCMTSNGSMRFWIETALATSCGFLALLTLVSRDWIEALTGYDPDQHDGSVEWMIVAALALLCVLLSLAALRSAERLRNLRGV